MIAAAKSIANAGGGSAATPAQGADAPATGFDAILSLESLAATIAAVDPATLTLDGLCPDELADVEFADADDLEVEEGDDGEEGGIEALAFLADLLNITAAARHLPAGGVDAEPAANDDVLSGGAGSADDSIAGLTATPGQGSDDAAIDKLIGLTALPQTLDAGNDTADSARRADELAGVTRATEWLHATRHGSAGPERAAIATHVRDPRWADDFSARIATMVRANESSASLQLSPVDLGPMDVSVNVKDNQASIHFGAAQAETRALIEASLPRLREMLAAQGFNLMDASVSSGFSRAQREPAAPRAADGMPAESTVEEVRPLRSLSLLDLYV